MSTYELGLTMLLTLTSTHSPAPDLGYLLHKHPARCQEFELSFGSVYVFFPEATEARCTAALLLDVDPVGMVKGKRQRSGPRDLFQYVNDRPYVGSSFLSVAIAQVFGSALNGTCKTRPELLAQPQELVATISALPCRRGGEDFLRRLFEPLGYEVTTTRQPLDETFPEWGESPYFTVTLRGTVTLAQLLTHIYVLVPVLDNNKHYFISSDEVDKLLAKGEGWLADHPECEHITRRFLGFRPSLARQAFARLAEEASDEEEEEVASPAEDDRVSLNDARLGAVTAAIRNSGAKRVLDLGCGEGRLLRELLKMREIEKLVGMDVSIRSLEIASKRLRLQQMAPRMRERIDLLHGSLLYRDARLEGFDAAAVVEVVEHLDPPRLAAFERVLFECIHPKTIALTTPNREYNVTWEMDEGRLRHYDHRFEWTREEFRAWADRMAEMNGYAVRYLPVGEEDPKLGAPTQMAIFELKP